ncbi:lysylphosphatidylglycerol synthase transmembrane domain-containing protein [Rhizobium sp. CF142]|uniref:lysylphosphatidylglycerol synthase transmembrane domain-containing protein n=1 Tax=Rhizobium sp. CF142 TaxID=1144314 RepID=UPI00026EFD4C|nr:lysylphosphatidylglycerol synthase transmembrane domain-containing protein [Rhizobium sp. CF142]EJJ28056.1 hypothetical protein PMI11_03660 [Rhizobium sp. CF142]
MVSLIFVFVLANRIEWRDAFRVMEFGISPGRVALFLLLTSAIAFVYALRWRLLLNFKLGAMASFTASIIGLGGNMLLPARGGDFLRVYYSGQRVEIPYAGVFSRLVVEKFVDLLTIFLVGFLAAVLNRSLDSNDYILYFSVVGFAGTLLGAIGLRFFSKQLSAVASRLLRLLKLSSVAGKGVERVLFDMGRGLSISAIALPSLLTLSMWVSLYAWTYILAGRIVGVSLSYDESIVVLFAGALGLMIPAAPSGVGTFHASIVSAFILLGRPSSEGLVLATAIHFLFLVIYAVPALMIGCQWRFGRLAIR